MPSACVLKKELKLKYVQRVSQFPFKADVFSTQYNNMRLPPGSSTNLPWQPCVSKPARCSGVMRRGHTAVAIVVVFSKQHEQTHTNNTYLQITNQTNAFTPRLLWLAYRTRSERTRVSTRVLDPLMRKSFFVVGSHTQLFNSSYPSNLNNHNLQMLNLIKLFSSSYPPILMGHLAF